MYFEYTTLFLFKYCLKYFVQFIVAVFVSIIHLVYIDVTRTRNFLCKDIIVYIITRYQKHNVFRLVVIDANLSSSDFFVILLENVLDCTNNIYLLHFILMQHNAKKIYINWWKLLINSVCTRDAVVYWL